MKWDKLKNIIKAFKKVLQPKFVYPIYFKGVSRDFTVKFTDLEVGIVIEVKDPNLRCKVGDIHHNLIPHTDTAYWIPTTDPRQFDNYSLTSESTGNIPLD